MKDKDPLSAFVEEGRKEKGERVCLKMSKSVNGAGFCLKCKGGKKAVAKLAEIMNGIDLGKHQLPEKRKAKIDDNYSGNETRGDVNGISYD